MTQSKMYKRHRFPPESIQYAVWVYQRFNLGRHLVSAEKYRYFPLVPLRLGKRQRQYRKTESAFFTI
jgi:hypothetical protein